MTDCPTPDKHEYPSERAAKQGRRTLLKNRKAGRGRLVVYPCGSHWHVGHGTDTLEKRRKP